MHKLTFTLFLLCGAACAQTFTTQANFTGPNGYNPLYGPLVQAADGNFYGTTASGGSSTNCFQGCGVIYQITPAGNLTVVHSFSRSDGFIPGDGIIATATGAFYGTTQQGGTHNYGTIFRLSPPGTLTTLYNFDFTDGAYPTFLTQGAAGFYGVTPSGGANNYGSVYMITPAGALTTLHNFTSFDGAAPFAGLTVAGNEFYGLTQNGGTSPLCGGGCGTAYKINTSGALTQLLTFNVQNGSLPFSGLVQATNGAFYGTTAYGGFEGVGTIFTMSGSGQLDSLHSFLTTDGANPFAGLIQATDGNFYGVTSAGGNGYGTIFEITPAATFTTLYSFSSADGAGPEATLLQATDGNFYGTTNTGGSNGVGTVFRLSTGLGPFVKTLPVGAKVGAAVTILGTSLTGATSVTFNGTSATFKVIAKGTAISTNVPAGATTGSVQVATPSGTLSSNVPFRVMR